MAKRSTLLEHKLESRLSPPDWAGDLTPAELITHACSAGRFNSLGEFRNHLQEGSLLNIGVIASRALSIPCGEYAVWATDSGTTVLVPTAGVGQRGDVVTHETPTHEVHTSRLLGSWNRLSRTIAEEKPPQFDGEEGGDSGGQRDHFDSAPKERPDGPYTFGSKVTRVDLFQAMKDRGIGDSELADAVGVDKSTISRLLRRVRTGQEEPGGRNPSAELALKISRVLGVPIDMVMPPESELLGNDRIGTTGSGKTGTMSRSRTGNNDFGKGSPGNKERLEALIHRAARLFTETGIDPVRYVRRHVSDPMVVLEFVGAMGRGAQLVQRGLNKASGQIGTIANRLNQRNQLKPFDEAIKAMTTLALVYDDKGYTVRVGKTKTTLTKFFENIIQNLAAIRKTMPGVEARHTARANQPPRQPREPEKYTYDWDDQDYVQDDQDYVPTGITYEEPT